MHNEYVQFSQFCLLVCPVNLSVSLAPNETVLKFGGIIWSMVTEQEQFYSPFC
jgi:hypothetical protein